MNTNLIKRLALSTLFVSIVSTFWLINSNSNSEREQYEAYLNEHPFLNRDYNEISELPKQDRPDLAFELEYLLTMDPKTRKPERQRLFDTYQKLKKQGTYQRRSDVPWVERGPSNIGGRTRAIAFDPSSSNKVWAGGVTGGLWYNNDITSSSSQWQSIDDFWDNLSITAIAFDPTNASVIYVGTGEGWGAGTSRGEGVWKSEDGGSNWNQLSSSTSFSYVNDIIIRNESGTGVLYIATSQNYYEGSYHGVNGIYRSDDGGATFDQVATFGATDLSLAADERIWAGTTSGAVFFSDGGTSFTQSVSTGNGRIALASAPSNANYVYALVENGGEVEMVMYTDDQGANWYQGNEPADVDTGIPDTDFTRGQAWYDLVVAVDPNDENTVIVGGIDLFRTTDGATNWDQISKWSNNNNLFDLNASLVHADQHAIIFKPGSSTEVVFGTDGGIYYSSDIANAATSDVIHSRNTGYNVTQFYTCAIHPTAGTDQFLAGSQDNGTQRFTTSGINETNDVYGGDGAYCAIDQTEPHIQIVSYVRNYYGVSTNEGQSFTTVVTDQSTGLFINPADYDDNLNILYSSMNESGIHRIKDIGGSESIGSISVNLGSTSSHLRVSPYTTSSTTLFAGTLSGRLFKITNADSDTPVSSEITGASFPSASISCVEIGASEDELLVTFSNYGVTSIWYTNDGGSNWSNKEGDFPDMPLRWALFNPQNRSEVILATDLGVWSTSDISASSPQWSPSNSEFANVRVDMLQYRESDNELIAATHGRGLFSSNRFGEAAPNVDFRADQTISCSGDLTVNFTNLTSSSPSATSFEWSFPGGSPSSSTLETPPAITYSTPGNYDVTLIVTNDIGQSTETKSNYINVASALVIPMAEGFEGSSFPPECWVAARGINGLGTSSDWTQITTGTNSGAGAAYVQYENVTGGLAEDWLITPLIDFSDGLKTQISFYMKDSYSTDYGSQYELRYSVSSQTDLSSFNTITTWGESDVSTNWEQYIRDISVLDGMEAYLAFVMVQDDGDDWALDDIEIYNTTIAIEISGNTEICSNESTTLTVTFDSDFAYQWQLDGFDIDGATNSTFSPTTSGSYSVNITYGSNVVTTGAVDIIVHEQPVITDQTESFTICSSETVTLNVTDDGSSTIYQWFADNEQLSDGGQYSGTTSATLQIEDITLDNAATYYCVLTNGTCEVYSNDIVMDVIQAPAISTQPVSVESCGEETVTFSVSVDGSDLGYQWFVDGTAITDDTQITGSATNQLVISNASGINEGTYHCEITSDCELLVSEAVTLTVSVCTSSDKLTTEEVLVFPNPSEGVITIDLTQQVLADIQAVEVINLNGKVIRRELKVNSRIRIDLENETPGLYFVRLVTPNGVINESFYLR